MPEIRTILSAKERAPIDRLIASLLVREVDRATWIRLREDPIPGFFSIEDPGFRDWIEREPTADRIEALAEEFARLFLLPDGVPPFASAWIEGDREPLAEALSTFIGETMEALGVEPIRVEPWGRLPLDHLALLLELVARAGELEGSEEGASSIQAHLHRELLGPWVAAFGRSLEARATSPIYRGLGSVLVALHGEC